ncbi:MAG TPA: beta-ketoacyl synthase N-terminal-like domain-containing protein, partial [Thermoanaerobaculia bacterium]
MGTTSGEPVEVERFDDRYLAGELDRVGTEFMGLYPCHMIAAHVARELGFGGVNTMIPAACAAGNYAVAHALDVLRAGRADLML